MGCKTEIGVPFRTFSQRRSARTAGAVGRKDGFPESVQSLVLEASPMKRLKGQARGSGLGDKRHRNKHKSVDWRPAGFSIAELDRLRKAGCKLEGKDYARLRRAGL